MALFLIVIVVAELIFIIDIERRYVRLKRLIDSDIHDCRVRLDAVEVLSDSVRKLNGVVKDLEQKQPKIESKNRMNTRVFIAGWDADEPEPIQQFVSKEKLMKELIKANLNCQRIYPLPQQCIYPWQPWQSGLLQSCAMLPLWYINRGMEDM